MWCRTWPSLQGDGRDVTSCYKTETSENKTGVNSSSKNKVCVDTQTAQIIRKEGRVVFMRTETPKRRTNTAFPRGSGRLKKILPVSL